MIFGMIRYPETLHALAQVADLWVASRGSEWLIDATEEALRMRRTRSWSSTGTRFISLLMLAAMLLLSSCDLGEAASMSNQPSASAPVQVAAAANILPPGQALPEAGVGDPQDGGEKEVVDGVRGEQSEAMAVDDDDNNDDDNDNDALVARRRVDKAEREFQEQLNEMGNSTDRRLQAMAEMAKEELDREGSMGRMKRRCWERLGPLPCGRSGATALNWGNKACLIGGSDDSMVYGDVRTFRMERGEWEEEAELEERRMYHASALVGDTMWVSGGFDGDEILTSVESLGPGDPEWSSRSPLSMERMDHAMVSLGGCVLVLGGSTLAEQYTRSVDVYFNDRGLWEASTPLSCGRRRFTAVVIEDRVYVMGGENEDGALDLVESWAPGESEWREEKSMPTARHSHCAVEMIDRVYLMGGHDGKQVIDTVESYHAETSDWREEPPLDMAARSQAACVAQGVAFVIGGFGPGGTVPDPSKTWLRTSTHGDEYDKEIEAMTEEMGVDGENETATTEAGGGDEGDGGFHVVDCEVDDDDDDDNGEEGPGMCTLRGVAVTPVSSYVYIGHAADYWKDADQPPEQGEMLAGLEEMVGMFKEGGANLEKVLGGGWQEKLAKSSQASGGGASGEGQAEEGRGVPREEEESEVETGLLARMSCVFNDAMDGLDLMEANSSVVQRTKRRVIDSLIREQIHALRASNFSFDDIGESSEVEEGEREVLEEGVAKGQVQVESMEGGVKQKRGEREGWSLPGVRNGESQRDGREGLRVTRRRGRGVYEEGGDGDDEGEGGGDAVARSEEGSEEEDGDVDGGSESVSSGEVRRRMELRKGSYQDGDDDDDDDDDDEDGQEVVVGLDGSITKVSGEKRGGGENAGEGRGDDDGVGGGGGDASSGVERAFFEAQAFDRGVMPREVERLERRVRRAEREAERERQARRRERDEGRKVTTGAGSKEGEGVAEEEEKEEEEPVIDEELRKSNPREFLRSLTGSQKPDKEDVMSFDERIAQPMSEMELFMEEAKRLTKDRGTEVQPGDVERWCTDPQLQRRYQEMVSRCGSDGGVGSVSSLTEDVSDVLPLRRGDDEKLTLFDDDVRRRAAEDNVALPEKFDTKGDLRSFMKELLAT